MTAPHLPAHQTALDLQHQLAEASEKLDGLDRDSPDSERAVAAVYAARGRLNRHLWQHRSELRTVPHWATYFADAVTNHAVSECLATGKYRYAVAIAELRQPPTTAVIAQGFANRLDALIGALDAAFEHRVDPALTVYCLRVGDATNPDRRKVYHGSPGALVVVLRMSCQVQFVAIALHRAQVRLAGWIDGAVESVAVVQKWFSAASAAFRAGSDAEPDHVIAWWAVAEVARRADVGPAENPWDERLRGVGALVRDSRLADRHLGADDGDVAPNHPAAAQRFHRIRSYVDEITGNLCAGVTQSDSGDRARDLVQAAAPEPTTSTVVRFPREPINEPDVSPVAAEQGLDL